MIHTQTLTPNEYQQQALTTCTETSKNIPYMVSGLASEALEVVGKINFHTPDMDKLINSATETERDLSKFKKLIRDHGAKVPAVTFKRDEVAKEIGDVLWYVASLAHIMGYTLEDIMEMNLKKLKDRKARGVISGSGDER